MDERGLARILGSDQAKTDGNRDGFGRGLGTELFLGAGAI